MSSQVVEKVKKVNSLDFVKDSYTIYGNNLIQKRAIPSIQDGLKPVNRRILNAMLDLKIFNSGGVKKSARTVGETLGKYHPHGDMAVYNALVNMVNSTNPYAEGDGNWGFGGEPPAAMRYTEAKLSKYAEKVFLNPRYLEVTPKIPNFDQTGFEYLFLPALLPNILLNKSTGIGVGAGNTAEIPSFELQGIKNILLHIIKEKKLTDKDCYKFLTIVTETGATEDRNNKICKKELFSLYNTGEGRIPIKSTIKRVRFKNKDSLKITKFSPKFINLGKLRNILVDWTVNFPKKNSSFSDEEETGTINPFSQVYDTSSLEEKESSITGVLKPNLSEKQIEKVIEELNEKLTTYESYKINALFSTYNEDTGREDITFKRYSVINLLIKWLSYRRKLELLALNNDLNKLNIKVHKIDLMILAHKHIDEIAELLKKKNNNIVDDLKKLLNITQEDAQYILSKQIISLAKVEEEKYKEDRDVQLKKIKETELFIKKPLKKVKSDLIELVDIL